MKCKVEEISRFGIRIPLAVDFEEFEYFGKGDKECYIDFQKHSKMGVWRSRVSGEYEHYVRPQESGNHMNTKWICMRDGDDEICVEAEKPFEFSALHYTIEALDKADHDFELETSNSTELLICYKNRGIGSHSCGPVLNEKYQVRDREIKFSFSIF